MLFVVVTGELQRLELSYRSSATQKTSLTHWFAHHVTRVRPISARVHIPEMVPVWCHTVLSRSQSYFCSLSLWNINV